MQQQRIRDTQYEKGKQRQNAEIDAGPIGQRVKGQERHNPEQVVSRPDWEKSFHKEQVIKGASRIGNNQQHSQNHRCDLTDPDLVI